MAVPIQVVPEPRALSPAAPSALFLARFASGGNIATAGFASRAQYAVAADGRFLNVASEDTPASPVTVVLNWDAELKN